MFSKTVSNYIAIHRLLQKEGKYLVALSGGADSVALLFLLNRLHYHLEAVHCNFKLRGEEADRDEAFCQKLCRSLNIPFHTVHFDTSSYARLHGISIEMAARELRYNYFESLRKDLSCDGICIAHHRDDIVETMLINLVRGTGLHGLQGILPRNGFILRPLLCVGRMEIEQYLRDIGQTYITDSTNLVADVVRNKIRLNIIPLLKDINPAACESMAKTASYVSEAIKVTEAALQEATQRVCTMPHTLSIPRLLEEPSPEYLLFFILQQYGFRSAQIEDIYTHLHASPGKEWLSATHRLLIDRDRLLLQETEKEVSKPLKIPEEGTYAYRKNVRFSFQTIQTNPDTPVIRDPLWACLDADEVQFPLFIRCTAEGDRFVPFGMKGSKLVSDFMTDRKMTRFEKREQLVVTDASGRIIWLVGQRIDNRYRISSETINTLLIRYMTDEM
ncbi:tRNA lysidine(34) synthetase TilS [Hoylesella marshii]|uniref:tRNA lysidine(34) synthetase TilS n=1 Tax=Hoylesella marshii TaxID=189722 RepID=UPI0028D8D8C4|nr:tRNA lysidine(34) synthetase TilS [Hoylesella marshii]